MSEEKKSGPPATPAVPGSPLYLSPLPRTSTPIKAAYRSRAARGVGITQVVLGPLLFLFALGIALPRYSWGFSVWQTLVGSFGNFILLVVTGGVGIGAAKKKTRGLIIAHMVLSILSAITLASLAMHSGGAIAENASELKYGNYDYDYDYIMEPDMSWNPEEVPSAPEPAHKEQEELRAWLGSASGDKSGDTSGSDGSAGDESDSDVSSGDMSGSGESSGEKSGSGDSSDSDDSEVGDYDDGYIDYITRCTFGRFADNTRTKVSLAMAAVVMITALILFAVTIFGSTLACKVTCCSPRDGVVTPGPMYAHPTLPNVVVMGGNNYSVVGGQLGTDNPAKEPLTKEQEALGLDPRALLPDSPPPPY